MENDPLECSVARILSLEGKTVGTGFLVADRLVVTCAHVVKAAKTEPGQPINIVFYMDDVSRQEAPRAAQVLDFPWSPTEGGADVAFLQVNSVPQECRPVSLASAKSCIGHEARCLGYSNGEEQASRSQDILHGLLIDRAFPVLEFKSDSITHGYSGAPVYDMKLNQVVGMVSWGYDQKHIVKVHAIPADRLASLHKALKLTSDLQQLREAYLEHLQQTYRVLEFRGNAKIDAPLRQDIYLEDVYVQLMARSENAAPEVASGLQHGQVNHLNEIGKNIRDDSNSRVAATRGNEGIVNVEDVLQSEAKILILGEPGAGKSTFMKYTALRLASQEKDLLPILVPLSTFLEDISLKGYLARYYADYFSDIAPLFKQSIDDGKAVILLDGLDEVMSINQIPVMNKIEALAKEILGNGNKIIVSSRINSYRETRFNVGWATYILQKLDDDGIEELAYKICRAMEQSIHGDTPDLEKNTQTALENIKRVVQLPKVKQLSGNPLFLMILVKLQRKWKDGNLPKSRIEILDVYLDTLVDTWKKYRSQAKIKTGTQNTQDDIDSLFRPQDQKDILGELALQIRENLPNSWVMVEENVVGMLAENLRPRTNETNPSRAMVLAQNFIDHFKTHSDLFVRQGNSQIEFTYSLLGETLAAVGLAQYKRDITPALERLENHLFEPAWSEIIPLYVGIWGILRGENGGREKAGEVIQHILDTPKSEERLAQNILIAGACLEEIGDSNLPPAVLQTLKQALLGLWRNPNAPVIERRNAGFVLGRTGWRPEDIEGFVCFSEKTLDNGHRIEPFSIAKYPVTNDQYRQFLEDDDYWTSEPDWLKELQNSSTKTTWGSAVPARRRPASRRLFPYYWTEPLWNNPLAPVVGITWYEAEAYCNWLSEKNKQTFRLPTTQEWEYAAQGPIGSVYPWGDYYKPWITNTAEYWWPKGIPFNRKQWEKNEVEARKIASTTAVGQFKESMTPTGIYDLAGNVWEWTGSWFDEDTKMFRVTHGGAWNGIARFTKSNYRGQNPPSFYTNYIGFRIVVEG